MSKSSFGNIAPITTLEPLSNLQRAYDVSQHLPLIWRPLYGTTTAFFRGDYLFIFNNYFIYFIFGCVGSSFLCEGFLQLWQAGATLHRGARASHYHDPSRCGAQAPDAQAQQLWLTGPVAPRHVGSSQTRARTRVPCIGRQILNHCATREAPRRLLMEEKGV